MRQVTRTKSSARITHAGKARGSGPVRRTRAPSKRVPWTQRQGSRCYDASFVSLNCLFSFSCSSPHYRGVEMAERQKNCSPHPYCTVPWQPYIRNPVGRSPTRTCKYQVYLGSLAAPSVRMHIISCLYQLAFVQGSCPQLWYADSAAACHSTRLTTNRSIIELDLTLAFECSKLGTRTSFLMPRTAASTMQLQM